MRVTGSPGVSGALPAAALLTVVVLVNAAEFSGLLGRFPGYGMLGVFGLAVVGGASVVAPSLSPSFRSAASRGRRRRDCSRSAAYSSSGASRCI